MPRRPSLRSYRVLGVALLVNMMICALPGTAAPSRTKGRAPAGSKGAVDVRRRSNELSCTYSFAPLIIEQRGEYVSVLLPGGRSHGPAGAPMLPSRTARVLLPARHRVVSISAKPVGKAIAVPGEHRVEFASGFVPFGSKDAAPAAAPDAAIYRSRKPYPGRWVERVSVQKFRGYRILTLRLYPVQYTPGTKKLVRCEKLRVRIQLQKKGPRRDRMLRRKSRDAAAAGMGTGNPQTAATYSSAGLAGPPPSESYDYLLITSQNLMSAFQPLVDHKALKGLAVATETVEAIVAGTTGVDNAETIHYETLPQTNPDVARFMGEYLGNYSGAYAQGGDMLDPLLPHFGDYDVQWLDDRPTHAATWSSSTAVGVLSESPHIITHFGHASTSKVIRMYASHVAQLQNTSPFLLYSAGCDSGAFDYQDCVGEDFVKIASPKGAALVIMNSRYGWFSPSQEWLGSGEYMKTFFSRLITQGNLHAGEALALSKQDMIGRLEATYGVYRWCYFGLNLLGDPETTLHPTVAFEIITPSPLPIGRLDSEYSLYLTGSGGQAPYTWSVASGALPAGLALYEDSGLISGIPVESGQFAFIAHIEGADGRNAIKAFTLRVCNEDFETGDFSLWPWQLEGDAAPAIVTDIVHGGLSAARLGGVSHGQRSSMKLKLRFTEAGALLFHLKVSSEEGQDYLRFLLDGVEIGITGTPSGAVGTTNYTAELDENTAVTLTAPATASDAVNDYDFVQWTLNGLPQTAGQTTVTFSVAAGTTAVAEYALPQAGRKGDFDEDGDIDFTDFMTFATVHGLTESEPGWFPNGITGDFDDDGDVDATDFAAAYGT